MRIKAYSRHLTRARRTLNVIAQERPFDYRRRTMSGELKQYADAYGALEGFMMPETTVIWDFLFAQQRNMKLVGDFLEIGVFKGKSALLAALYLQRGELA